MDRWKHHNNKHGGGRPVTSPGGAGLCHIVVTVPHKYATSVWWRFNQLLWVSAHSPGTRDSVGWSDSVCDVRIVSVNLENLQISLKSTTPLQSGPGPRMGLVSSGVQQAWLWIIYCISLKSLWSRVVYCGLTVIYPLDSVVSLSPDRMETKRVTHI